MTYSRRVIQQVGNEQVVSVVEVNGAPPADYCKAVRLTKGDELVTVYVRVEFEAEWSFGTHYGPYLIQEAEVIRQNLVTGREASRTVVDAEDGEATIAAMLRGGWVEVNEAEVEQLMDIGAELYVLPEPPAGRVPGTLAYSAWLMVEAGLMNGDEADQWKATMQDNF